MSNVYFNRFLKFQQQLTEKTPSLRIKYKDQSLFMKILGKLLFFNPKFMIDYITTIGDTIYFPSKTKLESCHNYSQIVVLTHEYQHISDSQGFFKKFWYNISYLFPQILFVPFLIAAIISIFFSNIVGIVLFILTFISLLPFPAPGRKYWELRGYTMSLLMMAAIHDKLYGNTNNDIKLTTLSSQAQYYNSQFTSAAYYFMWPAGVIKELQSVKQDIISGKIFEKDNLYRDMYKIFMRSCS